MSKRPSEERILREEEITGQIATFVFAGSDTTASVLYTQLSPPAS